MRHAVVKYWCPFQVDKYDDPNTAVNKIMLALDGMGFELNFSANRLKQVEYFDFDLRGLCTVRLYVC